MKNTKILMLSFVLTATTAEARERSLQEMQNVAAAVLGGNNATRAGVARPAVLNVTSTYTVLGYNTGGFAVVANDDACEPVLGYSNDVFTPIALPDGLRWWLESVETTLACAPGYVRTGVGYAPATVTEVAPMVTTRWGQEYPFNMLCPMSSKGTGYKLTGCVATAMAQIMKYHKWPEVGDGEAMLDIDNFLFADFANTRYDWANMLDGYDGGYSDAQAEAVATLMMHCGVSVKMTYGDEASGTQSQYVPKALREHFRYHRNVGYRNRAIHTNADWMGTLYGELAAGRPILYSGTDPRTNYGHAFVLDGYDRDGLVHVNWGWSGFCDGYFDVDILNSGYENWEFSKGQAMLVGFAKPDATVEHSIDLGHPADFVVKDNGLNYTFFGDGFSIYCYNDYDLVGDLAIVVSGSNGTTVAFDCGETTADNPWYSFSYVSYGDNVNFSLPQGLPDGEYRMYLAFKEEGSNEWQPLYAAEGKVSNYIVNKRGGNVTLTASTQQLTTGVAAPVKARASKGETYNLAGQRVDAGHRGVVVRDGKKILNR